MTILLLLIPLSLVLVGVAAWAFAWAVRGGQFDDLDTPALDILGEDRGEFAGDATPGTDVGIGGDPGSGSETNAVDGVNAHAGTITSRAGSCPNKNTTTANTTNAEPDAD